jgi:hypothetical protein
MRRLSTWVIALLAVSLVLLYVLDQRTIRELREQVRTVETSAQKARDEYETKLATLRAEHAARAREGSGAAPTGGLLGLLMNSPALARPHHEDSFREVVKNLGLDAAQHARVTTILDEFTAARRDVVVAAERAGASVAEAPHAEAMRRLQRDTLGRLQQVLKPAQYTEFLRLGYDRSLGLRAPPG